MTKRRELSKTIQASTFPVRRKSFKVGKLKSIFPLQQSHTFVK
jgi:hypothetical protein